MDRRREIREFLMSRRARVTPDEAGLYTVDGDVRRVPGLRREEVADLAGVSADYYTQLERGAVEGASDSALNAVARAGAWRSYATGAGTTSPPTRWPSGVPGDLRRPHRSAEPRPLRVPRPARPHL